MTYTLGILGCGDFLRWQQDYLSNNPSIRVHTLFDPDQARAQSFADQFSAQTADSAEAIFANPDIDVVALFVPPWLRRGLFEQAAAAGKDVIMTKPLASSAEDCAAMLETQRLSKIRCSVIYSRTDSAFVESCKALFDDGRLGRLALYRHDWIHAYPQWNNWATDPEKNGGPFMDAMIHNLNTANYLMGRPMLEATFFSDRLSHPDMACADTESLNAHYQGGVANLFITWAADLAVHSTNGNDREHIDIHYMVTDQGWHISEHSDGIQASRNGETEIIPLTPISASHYELFAQSIHNKTTLPSTLASIGEAAFDIRLLRQAEKNCGNRTSLTELQTPIAEA